MLDDLIKTLTAGAVPLERRVAAAICLAVYDDPRAEDALWATAQSREQPEVVLELCGRALAEIWCRKGNLPTDDLGALHPAAHARVRQHLSQHRPDWLTLLE